ncbi:conserved hypothetical protein [Talaromyces stipitatus ATCC 10500]|uniref:Uncharacterized protein n=1 Tax=Talaromyces stipitatus (strain ATCC 10500 / CBS 375.48 / QM 6759 / NRRL 1006) TaxID=441959 RepID=B8LTT6_TALSN|nr:uncharacterized protein TSTA_070840 [Talaromyces stipitatus ATCC 10500]EED23678.1 conserved hypothetical protein [Talaromyces stipitatus ATCC 10500]
MGIPLWRPPSPPEPKSSVKSDPCAHSRSSIRRRGAVRHVVSQTSSSNISPRTPLSTSLAQLESLIEGLPSRQSLSQSDASLFDWSRDSPALNDTARREEGSRLLRDALRHRQPGRRLRIPRESSLRFEMPTPPWSPSETLQRSSLGDYARIRQTPDSFSPRFAPAYARDSGTSARTERRSPPPAVGRLPTHMIEDGPAPGLRYLRRVGHRSVSENNGNITSLQQGIDGLGDRQRSASPDDDLDNAWETLLTTLTPDPNLPSTESSFTSNAATSSNRASESSRQSQTQQTQSGPSATVHMILEPYPDFFNPCDIPDHATDSDTEAESELDLRRLGSFPRRQDPRARLLDSTLPIGTTQDSQPPLSRMPGASSLHSLSVVSHDLSSGVDMQAIVDRLAQREHVPDGWWAAAGLPRTIGRQLDVGDVSPGHGSDGPTNAADEP